jgi:hypothetical protein
MGKIIFCLFLFLPLFYFSQNKLTVVGRVMDEHHIPLIGASVIDKNTKSGVTTNRDGVFFLPQQRQNINFEIEYTGYKPFLINIPADSLQVLTNDTLVLNFVMEIKAEQLETVVVSGENTKLAYNKPRVVVLDYDFYRDHLLLLIYENQKYKLRLADETGKDVYTLTLRGNPEKLFKDCYGNLHLLSTDSAYEIKFQELTFSLLSGHTIVEFDKLVSPILIATNKNLFYKTFDEVKRNIVYGNYDRIKKKKTELKTIRTEGNRLYHKTGFNQSDGVVIYQKEFLVYGGSLRGGGGAHRVPLESATYPQWKYLRNSDAAQITSYRQTILAITIYNPLILLNDSLFLFNHTEDMIMIYDITGNLSRKIPIEYHLQKGWKNELIKDYSKNVIYAKYIKNDHAYLDQINPISGQIIKEIRLEHKFAKDVKVKNGYIYFLYKDRDGELPIDYLFRQKIE